MLAPKKKKIEKKTAQELIFTPTSRGSFSRGGRGVDSGGVDSGALIADKGSELT